MLHSHWFSSGIIIPSILPAKYICDIGMDTSMQGTIARLEKTTHQYGGRTLFADSSCEIHHDARIGLIGPNGAGKSTILKLLKGDLEPSGGKVALVRGIRVGYLPQEVRFDLPRTIVEEVRDASPTLAALEAEMERLSERMGDPTVYSDDRKLAAVSAQYEHCLSEFKEKGGLSFENRVRATLRGLGFTEADEHLDLQALSGGQKKLVELAKLLIERPELLLLDEPDNHLDVSGKQFLEAWIADYPGAIVIVSHDRYLLDVVVDEMLELEGGRLTHYSGNYSEYAFEKQQKLHSQERTYHVQQREIRRMEFAIRRLLGWGAGQNEKLVRRGRSMQKRLDKIERVDKPIFGQKTIGLSFTPAQRGSQRTLDVQGLAKSFGAHTIWKDASFTVWNGQRVGLIGPNGSGKTVLLRCLLGEEKPDEGFITLGPSNTLGYYAQEHQTLNLDATLTDEIGGVTFLGNRALYGMLGRFLFTADDAGKRIRDLSGGEKARVQMARLMLSGANFLLLDEPTNHLDIQSAEILEEALESFEGTLFIISHDRYFLDNVVTNILELEDGCLAAYDGNYTLSRMEKERLRKLEEAKRALALKERVPRKRA
jgi:ATP-binding cassette, subfamily F, member 3